MKKRLLAGLLSVCMFFGLLPVSAMAADPSEDGETANSVEQTSVEVKYTDTQRSKATIIYHKKGIAANPFNVIFLVDTSRQGQNSHQAFEQMMRDSGMSYIYDYDAASTVQLIGYQQSIMENTGILDTKADLTGKFGQHGVSGEGTANEPLALQTATQAVKAAHDANDYPTVVFWVLGKEFGSTDTTAIEENLKALDNELQDGTDALVTWQYTDTPNELLSKYATQHTEAHGDPNQKAPAAHAANDMTLMQEEMAADLEEIVHDHYHNIKFSLELDNNQTLVKKITGVRYEASSSMASLTTTLRDDGKGLDVTIERQCRQIDLDFILDVELDTSVYEKQTVIPAGKIIASHNGDNGGLHTGLFDEQIEYGLELDLPSVEMDRTAHNITFQNADGVSNITNKLTGESVTLPMGDGLAQDGSSFGGWDVVSGANYGRHYAPGEIISMPAGDMTLEPSFGHVEVDLEIDYQQGEIPTYGNQMKSSGFRHSNPLDFTGVTLPNNGGTIAKDSVVSVQVINFTPQYDTIPPEQQTVDPLRVNLTNVNDAVYARHIGATENDKVVAYLVPNKSQNSKYDMIIAGPGGVKAPQDCSYMFLGQFYGDPWKQWASYLKTISLKALITSDVTNMKHMFAGCSSLTSLDLGDNFGTSQVTDMSFMFSDCSMLNSLDVSKFNTSNVTDMSYMFNGCSSLNSLTFGDGWDTSKVTDMSLMFSNCSMLNSLDVSKFNTSNVTDMSYMFNGCSSLKSLTLGNGWDTSKVTNMTCMFANCSCFNPDVGGWDTSNVTDMSRMFYNSSVGSLNLSGWNTSKVKNMASMFEACGIMYNLDVGSWNTSSVTNMSNMFFSCASLSSLNVGDWNTSNVTTMENMFNGCYMIHNLEVSNWDTSKVVYMRAMFMNSGVDSLDLSKWDTSNVTDMAFMFSTCYSLSDLNVSDWDTSKVKDMGEMFYECQSLKSLTFGDNWNTSNVTNMSHMFSGCSNLETIDGIGLGSNNVVSSFSDLFSGLTQLKSVTFNTPASGAEFSNLSTTQNMFNGCSSLTEVNLGNWKLPNLTNTDSMFSGCSSLTNMNLSWSGIKATQNNYSIADMFKGVPSSASLEIGSDNSQMMQAIRAAFPGSVTQDGQAWTASNQLVSEIQPDEVPQAPEETPDDSQPNSEETTEETPDDSQSNPDETPDSSLTTPDDSQLTPDEMPQTPDVAPDDSQQTPGETPDETPQTDGTGEEGSQSQDTEVSEPSDEVTEPTDEPSVMPLSTAETTLARSTTSYANGEESVHVHPDMVNAGDTITYKVTVKYVGDTGVKSGRITLDFPIPEDIQQFQGDQDDAEHTQPGWYVSTTQIDYSGSPTGYKGGRVVEEPTVKDLGSGQYALQGVFEGLYTGTEVTVSIITTVQGKQDGDYNDEGYAFWDGTAYATDSAGTSASQTVRLWNLKDGDPTPPTTTSYQLSYAFTGDVPSDAKLPQTKVVDSGTQVTAETKPTEPSGYTFDGWYRSDNGTQVTPGSDFNMPNSNLTLTGKWILEDAYTQKITVKYEYTDNNDRKHIPNGAPALPGDQTVKVGQTHYIQRIDENADYHKFGGWVPILSVDSTNVPLTEQQDGTYESSDGAYTIDVAGGTLSTEQFRGKANVVVTFGGAWIPYKGTIHFDANGGEGNMSDMTNVTWDTTTKLTKNTFNYPISGYQFIGWATVPAGVIEKEDEATANGLIDEDGKTVTLYAVWKRSNYGVGYDLSHVTSSSTETAVTLGGSYSTTLTVDEGYEMSDVSITMGGVVITSRVYNEVTGEVSISNINGNIIIKAEAKPKTATPEHTITVSVTNGTATPSGAVQVQDGQNQTITFAPNAGYVLGSVTVDGSTASLTGNSYTFTNVTSDHSISVVYQKNGGSGGGGGSGGTVTDKYPVHVESTGNGTATSDKQEAAKGEVVTIETNGTVTGITVVDKDGNGVSVTDRGDGSFTFEMPNSEVTVKVEFEPLPDVADPNDTGVADWLNTNDHISYLSGYPDGSFKPSGNMPRAEVAQMFYNLLLDKNIPVTVSFRDVKPESWYATAVNTLASLGIVTGVGNEQFAPERAITRAEFTAIAMRFATLDTTGINIFSDVKESDWFYDYVVGSIQYGWITGYEDGTFRPNNTISRAEVTTITNRMLGRAADESYVNNHSSELRVFPDVTNTHWAYYQIVEATNSHDFVKTDGVENWNDLN